MNIHEKYIKRCLQLAKNGLGITSPNPSVGCVLVVNDVIIGEGYTSAYGGNHAEVNAINSVQDKSLLSKATLYVSLEPCNHYGKTPPCADLIVKNGIKHVVIGCVDPFEKVAGGGIQKLKNHGVKVVLGVLERECLESNKRFFTSVTKKRPFVILKWAETANGFIDVIRNVANKEAANPTWISNVYSRQLVHKWRAEEDAILVGTNTVLKDNPRLTVRSWSGKNPVRVVLDRNLRIPIDYHIYDKEAKTIIFTEKEKPSIDALIFQKVDFSKNLVKQILEILQNHKINSVIIEGGKQTLQTFIEMNIWDEARIFTGITSFNEGIIAPSIQGELISKVKIEGDSLKILRNNSANLCV